MKTFSIHRAGMLLLVLALFPAQAFGQGSPQAGGRVPVMVVSVPASQVDESGFALLRRKGRGVHNLVLISSERLNEATVSEAIMQMVTLRTLRGDQAQENGRFRVHSSRQANLPWSGAVIERLRQEVPTEIDGVGKYPAVTIWLPRKSLVGR